MPPKGKIIPVREPSIKNVNSYDYYPDIKDPNFIEQLIPRKEFWKLRASREPTTMEEKCNPKRPFRKLPHQEFLENYIQMETPYNGILIFQGVGSGKTCAAILIAMGFRQLLKRLHRGSKYAENKKVFVLTPGDKIQDNFRKELLNFDKLFRSTKGMTPSQLLTLEGESQQCTGQKYMPELESLKILPKEQIEKRIQKKINNDFEFLNHQAFANRVHSVIGKNDIGELWDYKQDLTEEQRKRINRRYRNRVFVIDEIHNIRDNVDNKVPPVIKVLVENADNLRIVLMSATPMVDSPQEIIYIINLLLANDRRPTLKMNEIFDRNGNFVEGGEEQLSRASVGYISYLRSETPDRFPLRIIPKDSILIQPKFDWKEIPIEEENQMKYNRLLPVEFSSSHWEQYAKEWKKYKDEKNEEEEEKEEEIIDEEQQTDRKRYIPFIYLSNIWIPMKDGSFAKKETDGYGMGEKGKGAFQKIKGSSYHGFQYRLRSWAYENEKPFIHISNLEKYSSKMFQIYNCVNACRGISLISSRWKSFGVIPMALVLEMNGFRRFTGAGETQLLDKRTLLSGHTEDYAICAYCGTIRKNANHILSHDEPLVDEKQYPGDRKHVFKNASYALVTGETDFTEIKKTLLSPSNQWGGEIKILLGTDAIAEGVDTKNIRQVHIMEPRYNWSAMEQIVGRATRNCSHIGLPMDKRNVEIFNWVSVVSKQNIQTELVNIRYYRRAEIKDVRIKHVEHVLKISAVDCFLNKELNLFFPEDIESWLGSEFKNGKLKIQTSMGEKRTITVGDTPFSRICDYRSVCQYKCLWEPKNKNIKIRNSTYTLEHAKSYIDQAKREIRQLFHRFQRGFFHLDEIYEALSSFHFSPDIIHQAIQELMEPGVQLPDPYHRQGYLIYRGKYYVWQPNDVPNNKIPIATRWEPLLKKQTMFSITNKNNVIQKKKINIVHSDGNEILTKAIQFSEQSLLTWAFPMQQEQMRHEILIAMFLDRLSNGNEHLKVLTELMMRIQTQERDEWIDAAIQYYHWNWIRDPFGKTKPEGFFWNHMIYEYKSKQMIPEENSKWIQQWQTYISKQSTIMSISEENMNRSGGRSWKDSEQLHKIFGIMEKFKKKQWIFKIVDLIKEKGVHTLQQKKSKRSESRGKKCENFKLPELRNVIGQLQLPIQIDTITGKNICQTVEFYLRRNDNTMLNKKRWFISSIEYYLMNPTET